MNPFAVRGMIRDPARFVGRAAELNSLCTLLASMQSCSVVGTRRIGKSSLLYHLAQPSVYARHLPNPESYVFAFVDLQELVGLGPEDFFVLAVERLSRASRGRFEVDCDRDGARSGFPRFLERTRDAGWRLVLCCDEFEMLSKDPAFDDSFFTLLRGLCTNYSLALVTSSRSSLYELCHQGDLATSTFWNIFVEQTLGLMTEQEARTLVRDPFVSAGIELSREDEECVLSLAGRHPFFLQIACYYLFEARSADRQQSFGALEQQFWEEARRHYAYAWERLDEAEQKSLAALADVENGAVESAMFCRLRRQALVAGEPTSARLVSASWRRFIGEQVTSSPARVSAESETNRSTFSCADFELRIEQIDSQACRVLVMNSPAGQDAETCKLPFDLGQVGETIRDLERQIWRDAQVDTQGNTSPRAMGRALFHSVFSGAVSQLFFESLGAARSRGQGLRVKIHVDLDESPGLAALPWEFLYIDRRRQFLGLNQHTPIVRFLDVPRQPGAFPIGSSLRVLVALSSPAGEPEICVEQERESMLRAWGKSRRVSVEFLDPATPSALRKELERWQPHILHFTGHGCFEPATGAGMLLFENECGEQAPITGEQLQVLLSNAPSVRLAFLSACQSARSARSSDLDPFSGVAAALVMAGLPAVVAMQFPISTRAALVFGQEFYSRLAAGEPVDAAVASARRALHLEMASSFEWGTPALFMHVSDGRLFEMT